MRLTRMYKGQRVTLLWNVFHNIVAREVLQGEVIPTGYRIAYWEWDRDAAHVYPIGLHVLIGLVHRLWQASYRWIQPTALDQRIRGIRHSAFLEGQRDGYLKACNNLERLKKRA